MRSRAATQNGRASKFAPQPLRLTISMSRARTGRTPQVAVSTRAWTLARLPMSGRGVIAALLVALTALSTWTASPASANDVLPPGVPELLSPASGTASVENPVMRWNLVPRALRYSVDVTSTGPGPVNHCGGETATVSFVCFELSPGTYVWSVRAIGLENLIGEPTAPRTYTKLARLSTAPTLLAPPSSTRFEYPDAAAILEWTPVDHAARYGLQISDDPTFPDPPLPSDLYPGTELLATVAPASAPGKTRYWRVRGETDVGASVGPWSAIRSYAIDWPDMPQLVAPADGATVSTVTLNWDPVPGASNYVIEADSDPAFDPPSIRTWRAQPDVNWGSVSPQTLYWRVKALNGDGGETAWSVIRSVTVDPLGAPSAPARVGEARPAGA